MLAEANQYTSNILKTVSEITPLCSHTESISGLQMLQVVQHFSLNSDTCIHQ